MGLIFAQLDHTPVGPISFVAGDQGLQRVAFTHLAALKQEITQPNGPPSLPGLDIVQKLLVELNAYLSGLQRSFSVAIDWEGLAGFQRQVLQVTAEIPYGQVWTYTALAHKLGKPGAARAVGMALGRNPMPIVIPCHRVVGADGALRGYLGGEMVKAFLLTLEGHLVKERKLLM